MSKNNNYYDSTYDIARKSIAIAKNIGHPLIKQGYYNDEEIGYEYKYDQLQISYYKNDIVNGLVRISVDGTEVLSYNIVNREGQIIDGRWKDVIEVIYQQIDSILEKRRIEAARKKSLENHMLGMEEYFKYYLECKSNDILFDELNYDLKKNGISVTCVEKYNEEFNLSTGYYDKGMPYYIYTVFYRLTDVAQFMGNIYNIFPVPSAYAGEYKPGEWNDIFKKIVLEYKFKNKKNTQQKANDIADKILKKIKNYK